MSNMVVVVLFNEDGDPPSVEQMSKETLRNRLRENYYGSDLSFVEPGGGVISTGFFHGLLVVDGVITKPRVIQVATDYEI